MTDQSRTTPAPRVLVVGAGPTGLLLAGDLALAGVPVTLVEKRPRKISNLSRAFVLHARTLEQFDARGIAEDIEATGRRLADIGLFGRLSVRLGELPPASTTCSSSRSTRSRSCCCGVPRRPGSPCGTTPR